jgi:hypothetical protein
MISDGISRKTVVAPELARVVAAAEADALAPREVELAPMPIEAEPEIPAEALAPEAEPLMMAWI